MLHRGALKRSRDPVLNRSPRAFFNYLETIRHRYPCFISRCFEDSGVLQGLDPEPHSDAPALCDAVLL